MGVNGSRESGNNLHTASGFTPLTPLKRPGSIRKLKPDEFSIVPPSPSKSLGKVRENVQTRLHDRIENESKSSEAAGSCSHILQDVESESSSAVGKQGSENGLGEQHADQMHAEQLDSNRSSVKSSAPMATGKAVYGAAYPPEMAAAMMKQMSSSGTVYNVLGLGALRLSSGSSHEQSSSPSIPPSSRDENFETLPIADKQGSRLSAKFEKILEEDTVNLAELQSLCWSGCPPEHRANTWRLLLRYMPANSDRREAKMARLRAEYADAVLKYFDSYEAATASTYDRTMYNQIAVDLPRTNPSVGLFQKLEVQQCLHRILYVWAIRHPGTGYVQGINDLVTPFFFVFLQEQTQASAADVSSGRVVGDGENGPGIARGQLEIVEADCYHCLTNLLDNAQDNYVMDSKGIQEKVFMLKRIMARLDDKLVAHLDRMDVEFLQFAFRWFNCLLMREFSLAVSPPAPQSHSPFPIFSPLLALWGHSRWRLYLSSLVIISLGSANDGRSVSPRDG